MNIVLGSRGRLGRAIAESLPEGCVAVPTRAVYAEWCRDGAADLVSRFFEAWAQRDGGTVYVAAGLIDPRRSSDEHLRVNYLLARNVIEGATKLGFRVVTFGTVMEAVVSDTSVNPYFDSKIRLSNFVSDYSAKSGLALHVRIHTLFGGGLPEPFMFLGQMLTSLVSHSEFKMSTGEQLREYHHVDDDVVSIGRLLESGASGTICLSHGEPVTLKAMASYIFDAFQCPELLRVGAFSRPANDNYSVLFDRPASLEGVMFRDTLPAVADYLRACAGLSGE